MIDTKRLRELAALRPEGHKVLCLYLNLDPSEFPTPRDRATEFDSLLDVVERGAARGRPRPRAAGRAEADIERVRSWCDDEFDASGTRGVVVFACGAAGLFERARPGAPDPERGRSIDDSPFIEPLTAMPGGDGYGVLLINRQVARILAGGPTACARCEHRGRRARLARPGRLVAVALPARHRSRRRKDHLKHAADELFTLFKRGACSA